MCGRLYRRKRGESVGCLNFDFLLSSMALSDLYTVYRVYMEGYEIVFCVSLGGVGHFLALEI